MTKPEIIREIKKFKNSDGTQKYKYINVKGGKALLEDAPVGNLYYAYKNMLKMEQRKVNRTEVQLELEFVK
jgi:hypothetical protein